MHDCRILIPGFLNQHDSCDKCLRALPPNERRNGESVHNSNTTEHDQYQIFNTQIMHL